MDGILERKRVVLGAAGGIAAYKAPLLVRALQAEGASVQAVLTAAATRFVSPLVLETLTGRPTVTDPLALAVGGDGARAIAHTELAKWADVVLVAPATAQTVARLALGLADDALALCALASTAPLVVCPAMNTAMLDSAPVRRNLEWLERDPRVHVVWPDAGALACGVEGPGRLPDPPRIVSAARRAIGPRDLDGQRVVVTAGPTWESIDDVRVLTNRSSGRMGIAMALAAWERGAEVVLVHGPVADEVPQWVGSCVAVESAADMARAVRAHVDGADLLVMAAAVADWTPRQRHRGKRKKGGAPTWTLELDRTTDILAATRELAGRVVRVGFAAETERALDEGRRKLRDKGLDFIVVNEVGPQRRATGFGAQTNAGWILDDRGGEEALPLQSKRAMAHAILARVAPRVAQRRHA